MSSLSFWGAAGTVTGSKYLIESDHARVLVDCGLFQGLKELRLRNWQELPFNAAAVDAVILTHAHIDHTGYLPRFVRQGFRGPVYCSRGTADLLKILLPDSARLQEEDADYRNRHKITKHLPALPLYTEQDAREALKLLQVVKNTGQPFQVVKGISAQFRMAGHILGSSHVLVQIDSAGEDRESRSVLFSGDLGKYDQPIIRDPVAPPECDYLVVESTYGNRLHDTEEPKDALERIIKDAAAQKSAILIPAFAVGRVQELVYLIRELEDEKRIPILPVSVDSPMAAAATQAYARPTDEHDEEYEDALKITPTPLRTHSMIASTTREESKRLNAAEGARIIISASGMMNGGRVLHHALRLLPDENATVVFVGYQAAGTLGRRVADGQKEVKVLGQWIPVRCKIEKIGGFSAHADWKEVVRWLEGMPAAPRRVFITHGEPDAAQAMAGHLRDRFGWQIEVPQYGEKFELA
ncbi:MAG TPA: MBL fold metallo-hydrolase [Pyrinomonadaceae bacterium]